MPRFAQQLSRHQIGLLNPSGAVEADVRDRRKIVKIDKSLNGGFQFDFWIPERWHAPGTNRRAILPDRPGRSFRHFRGCSNGFAIASDGTIPVLAITLCPVLLIYATRHLSSRCLFWLHRFSSYHRYRPA